MFKFFNQKNNGFTLVELMVATSLFMIIMISAIGSLIMLIDESKNSRSVRIAMENVNFAMESMTRSIRMGTGYYCGNISNLSDISDISLGCTNGGSIISFVPQEIDSMPATSRVEYRLESNTIKRFDSTNSVTGVPIVSSDVSVSKLKFFVRVDGVQPMVYIIMEGTVKVNGVPTSFALQTLASQRNF